MWSLQRMYIDLWGGAAVQSGELQDWVATSFDGQDLDSVRFGDFDGDGLTDAARCSGGCVEVSDGRGPGSQPRWFDDWEAPSNCGCWPGDLQSGVFADDSLPVGDTSADDLFYRSGGALMLAQNARTPAVPSLAVASSLARGLVGDFDGDGFDELAQEDGSEILVLGGDGTVGGWPKHWTPFCAASWPALKQYLVADVDGDSCSDLVVHGDGVVRAGRVVSAHRGAPGRVPDRDRAGGPGRIQLGLPAELRRSDSLTPLGARRCGRAVGSARLREPVAARRPGCPRRRGRSGDNPAGDDLNGRALRPCGGVGPLFRPRTAGPPSRPAAGGRLSGDPELQGGDGLPDAVDSQWRAGQLVAAPPHRLTTASWDKSST